MLTSNRSVPKPSFGRWLQVGAAAFSLAGIARVTHSSIASERENFKAWPSSPLVKTPAIAGIPGLAEVNIEHPGQPRIGAWFAAGNNGAVVILAHGTSADRTSLLPEARVLSQAGFGVLAFDWPGYGESPGTIDWGRQERKALTSALDWLVTSRHIDPAKIGGFGLSMGGYMLAQVAAGDKRMHALALAATPPDIIEQTRYEHRKWGLLSQWPANLVLRMSGMPLEDQTPLQTIGRLSPRPVLLLGGGQDTVVSTAMVRQLYDSARQPKDLFIVQSAGHGNYMRVAPEDYRQRLISFFECGLLLECTGATPSLIGNDPAS